MLETESRRRIRGTSRNVPTGYWNPPELVQVASGVPLFGRHRAEPRQVRQELPPLRAVAGPRVPDDVELDGGGHELFPCELVGRADVVDGVAQRGEALRVFEARPQTRRVARQRLGRLAVR